MQLHYKRLGPEPKCTNPTCPEVATCYCDGCDKPHCNDCSTDFTGSWHGDTTQCHVCTDRGYEDFRE